MKLAHIAFDGHTIVEQHDFETSSDAWDHANDLGSTYYFNPFSFVVSDSGKTIIDAPWELMNFIGKRVKTVSRIFKDLSAKPEADRANYEYFTYLLNS